MFYDRLDFNRYPIYFDSLPEIEQKKLIDQFTNSTQSNERSDRSIVHDVVHLHSDRLFRIVFINGCPSINKVDNEGSTPLLKAVAANDEALVIELLKHDVGESINLRNDYGITPLHAAVEVGNAKMVELLLNHGAINSIYYVDDWGRSPLHLAASLKEDSMADLLLKNGAKSLLFSKDNLGLNPFQRAIISGRVSIIKLFLKYQPMIPDRFNRPDSFRVTDLQRAARSGNMEMMHLLLSHSTKEKIRVNPGASFTEEDLESCLTSHSANFLERLSIEDIAFPFTVAQNFCNVMVRLKEGKILKIPNADAGEVRTALLQKKYGDKIPNGEGKNILTFYVNPAHGFLRLECRNCDDQKPFNRNKGFYPNGDGPSNILLEPEPSTFGTGAVVGPAASLGFKSGTNRLLKKFVGNHPILKSAGGFIKMPFVINPLITFLYSPKFLFEGDGKIKSENLYESISDLTNALKIMFYVNDEQAKAALDTLNKVNASCYENPSESCRYYIVGDNCLDFLQEVFESTGSHGDFFSYFTDEQFRYHHLANVNPMNFESVAPNYGFIRSRGIKHYLSFGVNTFFNQFASLMGQGKDFFANSYSIPNYFVHYKDVDQMVIEKSTEDASSSNSFDFEPLPPLVVSDAILSAAVVCKVAIDTYHFFADAWSRVSGEKPTEEEFSIWMEQEKSSLKNAMKALQAIEERFDDDYEIIRGIDEEISQIEDVSLYSIEDCLRLEILRKERNAFRIVRHRKIDLQFEGLKLKAELKSLKKHPRISSKGYLEKMHNRIKNLNDQIIQLKAQLETQSPEIEAV